MKLSNLNGPIYSALQQKNTPVPFNGYIKTNTNEFGWCYDGDLEFLEKYSHKMQAILDHDCEDSLEITRKTDIDGVKRLHIKDKSPDDILKNGWPVCHADQFEGATQIEWSISDSKVQDFMNIMKNKMIKGVKTLMPPDVRTLEGDDTLFLKNYGAYDLRNVLKSFAQKLYTYQNKDIDSIPEPLTTYVEGMK